MPFAHHERGASIDRSQGVLTTLRGMGDPTRLVGMARYGINTDRALGVTVTELRAFARTIGRDHELAAGLWASGVHEARILATIIDEPALVTEAQMEAWAGEFDSWDLCDQACLNLFERTPFAFDKAADWAGRREEFVKRAGFALMAVAAVHRKEEPDRRFEELLPLIRAGATDDRYLVKKAVSWALRQIGKRSPRLHGAALRTARQLAAMDARAARWIARDALRELESPKVLERVGNAR